MRNVNIFKIKYIIALFRWYFKVSKYIKPNKTNISLSRRMLSLWFQHVFIKNISELSVRYSGRLQRSTNEKLRDHTSATGSLILFSVVWSKFFTTFTTKCRNLATSQTLVKVLIY